MSGFELVMTIDDGTVVRVPFPDRPSARDAVDRIARARLRGDTGSVKVTLPDGSTRGVDMASLGGIEVRRA